MARLQWVVVVEAEAAEGERAVEVGRLRRLLENLRGLDPIGLHSADRVAVQLHIDAPGELEALALGLAAVRAAVLCMGVSELRVIRAEVLTWKEFERDRRLAGKPGLAAGERREVGEADDADQVAEQLLRQVFPDPLVDLPGPGLSTD